MTKQWRYYQLNIPEFNEHCMHMEWSVNSNKGDFNQWRRLKPDNYPGVSKIPAHCSTSPLPAATDSPGVQSSWQRHCPPGTFGLYVQQQKKGQNKAMPEDRVTKRQTKSPVSPLHRKSVFDSGSQCNWSQWKTLARPTKQNEIEKVQQRSKRLNELEPKDIRYCPICGDGCQAADTMEPASKPASKPARQPERESWAGSHLEV